MGPRHYSGGVACWHYCCQHIARNDDGSIYRDNKGLPMLIPDNHPECGMYTVRPRTARALGIIKEE